ncbi:hypothetical protein N9R81_01500 [Flavobacteriales bacterium]|nr:hypothetical protein [Flavobacteriales bacterium]
MLNTTRAFCQSENDQGGLYAKFDTSQVVLQQGEAVANKLLVTNRSTNESFRFMVRVNHPASWKELGGGVRIYSIEPGDTFYIPIRLIPNGKILGRAKYLITAYVIEEQKNVPVTSSYFMAEKPKIIDWELKILPESTVYLKNQETETEFTYNLINKGNEEQEFTIDLMTTRTDRLILMDEEGKILKKNYFTFSLQPLADTSMKFKTILSDQVRNHRIIDLQNYVPFACGQKQKYNVFVHSRESARSAIGNRKKSKRVDIVKLPSDYSVNKYSSSSFPLLLDANVSNVLGGRPIMNVLLMGSKVMGNGALLNYSSQTFFSSPYASTDFLLSSFLNISYAYKKYRFTIGNVGGYGISGRGLRGSYEINDKLTIGGFGVVGRRLIDIRHYGLGGYANYRPRSNIRIGANYSRGNFFVDKYFMDFSGLNLSYSFLRHHSLNANGNLVRIVSSDILNPYTRLGYGGNINYGVKYLKGKVNTSLGAGYNSGIQLVGQFQGSPFLTITHGTTWRVNSKWKINLLNNYFRRDSINQFVSSRSNLNNRLRIDGSVFGKNIAPTIFYNIQEQNGLRYHIRGIGMGSSRYRMKNRSLLSINVITGYKRALDVGDSKEYFFLQSFLLAKYRVWSANIGYSYGNMSVYNFTNSTGGTYPTLFSASINNQHQFKNTRFVLATNATYRYLSQTARHSIGVNPQLYYFTAGRWRFYVLPGYFVNFSTANSAPTEIAKGISQNMNVNFGVRKEFGIPAPWIKEHFPSIEFVAFLDHNGNGEQDNGEISLENVVIKLGAWDVITGVNGKAKLQNVFGDSLYNISAMSLVDLNGYFPNIPEYFTPIEDSVFAIPFVKGVKIFGQIYVDREDAAVNAKKAYDLSGIRISAYNGHDEHTLTDYGGNFSMYVPYGEYRISMDDEVLGSRFSLLENNFELTLDGESESVFVTFYLVERRRKVNIKKFGSTNSGKATNKEENNELKEPENSDQEDVTPDNKGTENERGSNNIEEILSPEILEQLVDYLTKNITNNYGSDYDGITEEEWVRIENLIRKIHNEDEDSEVNVPSPLPNPVKLEVDEVNFTQVVDMYEDRLNAIDKQIQSLEQQLQATNNPGERERLQSQIDALQKQKELIDKKHDGAVDRLQNIRSELGATKKNTGQRNEASKAAEFSLNNGAYNNSTIPLDEQLPDGLIYRIQLGVYSHTVEPELFNGLYPLAGTTIAKGKYAYSTGIFYSYDQATEADKQIREKGISDAFVIAYYNGKKISVSQALRLE